MEMSKRRAQLIDELAKNGDLRHPRVREVMLRVPRHIFVPNGQLEYAYENYPLPIGYGQTISQPAIVALMTEALELTGTERILEVGTGSGYQAAILSLLAREVFSVERVVDLGKTSRSLLESLGLMNVNVRVGDGYAGWPEEAPFDRIIATAAPPTIPPTLLDQLAEGGVLVTPVGDFKAESQWLLRIRKRKGEIATENLGAVRFVPMLRGSEREQEPGWD